MKKALFIALVLVAICTMPLYGQNPKSATTGTLNDHEWVDLGLPSGTLWATCNVGANAPEEYGDYFAWGEIQMKDSYLWETYQYANGACNKLTKYCSNPDIGNDGFTDSLTILLPEDDAATANWGKGWCTPTYEQWKELLDNTTNKWMTQDSVRGRLFIAENGQTLFLPAAGGRSLSKVFSVNGSGGYWSRSLYSLYSINSLSPWCLIFYLDMFYNNEDNCYMEIGDRWCGCSVRPVTSSHE